jgi:NCAIR mutase (PurE)-related protein
MSDSLKDLLERVANGRQPVIDALAELERLGVSAVGDFACLDLGRARRKGVPEVVFSQGKSADQLVAIVAAFLKHSPSALCSRVSAEQAKAVRDAGLGAVDYDDRAGVLVARRPDYVPPEPRGVAGVLAAGTSDVAIAEEAAVVCREMGVTVHTAYDVGVAGVHRLGEPLERIISGGATVLVVAAGMEGALPSVVAGMVDVPVIGLPTSSGYGIGGKGEAAILGMLQSCSPGLVVVNVDNGVGAGVTAAMIARRCAA